MADLYRHRDSIPLGGRVGDAVRLGVAAQGGLEGHTVGHVAAGYNRHRIVVRNFFFVTQNSQKRGKSDFL